MTSKTPSTSSSSVSNTSEAATSSNKQMTEPSSGRGRSGGGDNENSQLPTSKNNAKFNRLCHNSRDETKLGKQLFEHHPIQDEHDEDHEEALCYEKQKPTNKQLKRKKTVICLVILAAMIFTASIAAFLAVFLLSNNIPNQPIDKCGDSYLINPRYSEFKLFGTKTSYSDAITSVDIERLQIFQASNKFNKQPESHNDESRQNPLPSSSSGIERYMLNVDSQMRNDKCQLRQFHFFGRHAARYPSGKEIEQINNLMNVVKSRIDLTKLSQAQYQSSAISTNAGSESIPTAQSNGLPRYEGNNTSETGPEISQGNKTVCVDPLTEFAEWTSNLYTSQDDLILESGYRESEMIAKRLKSLYPIMFDGSASDITLKVTDKIRTVQTALPFLRLFDNYTQDICRLDDFPTDASSDKNASIITHNSCYKNFIDRNEYPDLRFYKECEKKGRKSNNSDIHIHDPSRLNNIARSVSKLLKLVDVQNQLNSSLVDAIYRVCKFETAQKGKSIWCRLFSEDDLKYLDFKEDIDDYFNQALYNRDLYEPSCKLTHQLYSLLLSENATTRANSKPKAFYHFAHAETLQRLLAYLAKDQLLDHDLYPDEANKRLQGPESIKYSPWRSSLLSPFSANIAFSWYYCPGQDYKLVASVNERPIKLDKCNDVICLSADLTNVNTPGLWTQCDFDTICRVTHTSYN